MAESDKKDAEAAKTQTDDTLEAAVDEGTTSETGAEDAQPIEDSGSGEETATDAEAPHEEPAVFEGTIIDPEVDTPDPLMVGAQSGAVEDDTSDDEPGGGDDTDFPAPEVDTALDADEAAGTGVVDGEPSDIGAAGDDPTDTEYPDDAAEPQDELEDTGPSQADATPEPAQINETAAAPIPPAQETVKVVERKGGAGAMVLGGVISAALGFGAAQYSTGGWPFVGEEIDTPAYAAQDDLDALSESMTSQSARIDDVAAAADAAASNDDVTAALADMRDAVEARLDALAGRIDQLATRVTELEKAPLEDNVSEAAIAAYEEELRRLQESVAAQRAEMETMAGEAAQMEANAVETARETMARSAVVRILSALDSGAPFEPALSDLARTGVEIPDVLQRAADEGVPTQAVLEDTFPDSARDALSAARDEAGDGGNLGNFLKRQLGARSVAPRDGDDPDAVLSRVEAAIEAGRLTDALAEIETLPASAQAALGDWVAAATLRRDALDAAEGLAQSLND